MQFACILQTNQHLKQAERIQNRPFSSVSRNFGKFMKINRDEQEGLYHSGAEIGGSNPLTPTLILKFIFNMLN